MPATVETLYRVRVLLETREDGGLRAWSDDLPELVLSHGHAPSVLIDLPLAIGQILRERLGGKVRVSELHRLPGRAGMGGEDVAVSSREYAACMAV